MKTILMFAIAFLPVLAHGIEKIDPIYALDCPGAAKPVLSIRHELKKEGIDLPWDPVPAPGDPQTFVISQYGGHWSSVLNRYLYRAPADKIHDWDATIDWRTDIQIQPTGVGLPEKIDGCSVIPVLINNPSYGSAWNKPFIGSETDFMKMDRLDRVLAFMLFVHARPQLLKLIFRHPDTVVKSAREKAALLASAGHDSFLYTVGSHRNAFAYELKECEWWPTGLPRECSLVRSGSPWAGDTGPILSPGTKVNFFPMGVLRSGVLFREQLIRRSQNPESRLYSQQVKCIDFTYYASGYLKECWQRWSFGDRKEEFRDGEDGL